MKMLRFIAMIGVCILLMCTPVKAEITPQLLQEWNRQPNNVQWNVYYQNTNIQVVDTLPWVSPSLYDTYAFTSMYKNNNGLVDHVDMYIRRGNESALTHEVGHVISNAGRTCYWWCYQPCFIQIWQVERYNNVMMPQGFDDIREYFACSYDMYIRYPQILKQTNPMTYNYMIVVLRNT